MQLIVVPLFVKRRSYSQHIILIVVHVMKLHRMTPYPNSLTKGAVLCILLIKTNPTESHILFVQTCTVHWFNLSSLVVCTNHKQIKRIFACIVESNANKLWPCVGADCDITMIIDLNELADECKAKAKHKQEMENER